MQFFGGVTLRRAAGPGFVDGFAIGARGERHVIGVLVAAFDLEGGDAGFDDLRDLAERVEIAGRKQIAGVGRAARCAVHQQFVGQAAGLGALAAVGAAAAPGFRRKTLAGVGNAQRAVDEDFEVALGFGGDGADFLEREFAGEGYAVDAEAARQFDAARRR